VKWLELQIEGICCLISEIEVSGGGLGGITLTDGSDGKFLNAIASRAEHIAVAVPSRT
jgi:hypothetical protein